MLDATDFEEKSAKAVKQTLATKMRIFRFRQKLFLQGDFCEIPDDEAIASAPVRIQLVVLEFCAPDAAEDEQMM